MFASIPGGGGLTIVTKKVTFASGAATVNHGLRKFTVLGAVKTHASVIAAETIGLVGTPDDEGFVTNAAGQATLDSSDGSSSSVWLVTFAGY